MSRLIDADELIKATQHAGFIRRSEIEAAPTVDAEPVVHGRWLDICKTDARLRECSVCHNWQVHYEKYIPKYCQECGARMDGDSDVLQ